MILGTNKAPDAATPLSGPLVYGSICRLSLFKGLSQEHYLELAGSDAKAFEQLKDNFETLTLDQLQNYLEPVGLELVSIKKIPLPGDAKLRGKTITYCHRIGGGNITSGELLKYFAKRGVELQLRSRA